jgi:GDPmannose 4,6-dehydratase
MSKRALITGITGQDGSFLAELLLDKGYEVHGMVRRASTEKFERIEHLRDRITLHQGDLLDHRSLIDTLRSSKPDEVYNLAAMSFVGISWIQPTLTPEFTGVAVTRLLEGIREVCPDVRFYQGPRARCSARSSRPRRPRRRRSIPAPPTVPRRPTATTSRSTTASPTTCS